MNQIKELLQRGRLEAMCLKHPLSVVLEGIGYDGEKTYVIGWNGPDYPHKCFRAGLKSGQYIDDKCPTIHAEPRGLIFAEQRGVNLEKGKIYMSEWFPCADCAQWISDAKLGYLITPDTVYKNEEEHVLVEKLHGSEVYQFELAEQILTNAGVKIIIDPSIRI